ncbi:ATP-binding protein [Dictyobacter aurantiacus]|uniref:AAA+ ATPase domain-containing protein n=1 Tax=Dictyobacter aurantiacus TaxID=1936993 RepID=A0A401ZMU9_9CHLR|nr:ATP-binding protein [Dictyobacter aurantiacus]GCE08197.1 hypothetical protein KDAU_55260 [Dictyobacter aurantiacus]
MDNIKKVIENTPQAFKPNAPIWHRREVEPPTEMPDDEEVELDEDEEIAREQKAAHAAEVERNRKAQLRILHPNALAPQEQIETEDEPQQVCTRCHGRRYFRLDVPFGHHLFGKAVPCDCLHERQREIQRQHLRQISNLDTLEEFSSKSLHTFDGFIPGSRIAFQQATDYANQPEGWLIFIGPNGCGKTHLAVSIARQRLEAGNSVLFMVAPDLLDYLRATYAPDAPVRYDKVFQQIRETELLVLDDLGAEQDSPWAIEKLFQLLNYRYNAHLPTVITTNLIGLAGIEPRIRSRLQDKRMARIISMDNVSDYRQKPTPSTS